MNLINELNEKLNQNIQNIQDLNQIDYNFQNELSLNNEGFNDYIVMLIEKDKNENNSLEKLVIKHYHDFVQKFPTNYLDEKLLLLVAITYDEVNRTECLNQILQIVDYLLGTLIEAINQSADFCMKKKKMLQMSFCYFLRIVLLKLNRSELAKQAEKIINVLIEKRYFSFESVQVVGDVINNLDNNEASKYMYKFIAHLLIGLDIDNNLNEDFNHRIPVIFLCIVNLNDYAVKFQDILSPFLPEIMNLLEKNCKKLKFEQDGYEIINMILEFFNTCIDEYGREFLKFSHEIIMEIIDEISFKKNTVYDSNELILMRAECLKCLTQLCSVDLSFVFKRKNKIIELLNEISVTCAEELENINAYEDDDEYFDGVYNIEYLLLNSFYLIDNMIKYWNHEIYLLLDCKSIQNIIELANESDNYDLNEIAKKVKNDIDINRSDLIRHHIKYGYSKIFKN